MFRRSSKSTKEYIPYKFRKEPDCCEQLKKESVNDYLKHIPEEIRFDCSFVGTRADESRARRLNILLHCRTYETDYQRPYKIRTVQPLAFWTDQDIEDYFKEYSIPINPAYAIHSQDRLGCASCPAHIKWEIRLAKDKTAVGMGMLLQNLRIIYSTQVQRFWNTVYRLRTSNELTIFERERAEKVIQRVLSEGTLKDWKQAEWDEELLPQAELMMSMSSLESFV
jgi:3'-phosphoadenosine 5'-phosphosulfate sulfotransferase (PAPS reductase)/FAD synthetase